MKNYRSIICITLIVLLNAQSMALEEGQQLPSIQLPVLEDEKKSNFIPLANYEGKHIYLDFWASWCEPCKKSFPILNKLHNNYKSLGFEVIAVNLDENLGDTVRFLKKHPVDYTILLDSHMQTPEKFGIPGMPTAFIIDPNGKVLHRHVGFRKGDGKKIESLIDKLFLDSWPSK